MDVEEEEIDENPNKIIVNDIPNEARIQPNLINGQYNWINSYSMIKSWELLQKSPKIKNS